MFLTSSTREVQPLVAIDGRPIDLDAATAADMVELRLDGVDLVVVGPEAWLAAGLVDALRAEGVAAFGPPAEVARLESSKAFAKEVMAAAGVPTGAYEAVATVEAGMAAIDRYPVVVKADGLAAGKGVIIAADEREDRAGFDEGEPGGRGASARRRRSASRRTGRTRPAALLITSRCERAPSQAAPSLSTSSSCSRVRP